jgi:hypothetical protein
MNKAEERHEVLKATTLPGVRKHALDPVQDIVVILNQPVG